MAKAKKAVLRKAVYAFCKQCLYDPKFVGGGTWREQIAACTSPKCPLYAHRPMPAPPKSSLAKVDGMQQGSPNSSQDERSR